jgi:ATP-dependent Lon protease
MKNSMMPESKDNQSEKPNIITGSDAADSSKKEAESLNLPDALPVLPLRGLVVYPRTVVPLIIGQSRSVQLINDVVAGDRMVILTASRNPDIDTPTPEQIYEIGTIGSVHRLFRAPDDTVQLLVQGMMRVKIVSYIQSEPYLKAQYSAFPEVIEEGLEMEAMIRTVLDQFRKMGELSSNLPGELLRALESIDDPVELAYAAATYLRMEIEAAQEMLEVDSVMEKLRRSIALQHKELEVLELGRKIQDDAKSEIDKGQREYILREQLKAIQRELGEGSEQEAEITQFRKKIDEAGLPEEVLREANREVERLVTLPSAAAEYGVIRTYLDWLVSLPWNVLTPDNLDIANARTVLNEDHYGLEDVKTRILEFLAVRKMRKERAKEIASDVSSDHMRRQREGVILCFVGPPGVGKTSLGASIARALGRKFTRMSLGGVHDEAEIRGHRRTYIGALPGTIIQSLRRVGSRNPVFMLDEIDKVGSDFRGDPASALLEVLDSEQNIEFRDHYLDVAIDLSQVMFITTANTLDTIPGPLRDRMEIIQLSGYTESEKVHIAQQYLVPRQIRENGLRSKEIKFSDEALLTMTRNYTREAGVRNLEREIGAVCRKVVTQVAEGTVKQLKISPDIVQEFLGKQMYYYASEIEDRTNVPGVATGLVWTPVGGDIVFVEAASMPGGNGFIVTGQLGDVMQESARAALSYIRSRASDFGIADDWFEHHDIHLHVPAGAVPKDGPSAGITIATALASLLTRRPVRSNVAMTGEITLRGQVLPIGGLKEKVLAAHRSGLDTVIVPGRNEKDIDDIPEEIRKQLKFVLASDVEQVFAAALGDVVSIASEDKNAAHQGTHLSLHKN